MFSTDVPADSRFISIWRVIPRFPAATEALLQQMSPRISLCGVNRLHLFFLFSLRLTSARPAPRSSTRGERQWWRAGPRDIIVSSLGLFVVIHRRPCPETYTRLAFLFSLKINKIKRGLQTSNRFKPHFMKFSSEATRRAVLHTEPYLGHVLAVVV